MAHDLTPAEVEKFLGESQDNLRQMRQRGMLGGIGTREGARWVYSRDDVLEEDLPLVYGGE